MRKALFFGLNLFLTLGLMSATISAQSIRVSVEQTREADGFPWTWYALIIFQAFVLVIAIFILRKKRAAQRETEKKAKSRKKHANREMIVIDTGSEINWENEFKKL